MKVLFVINSLRKGGAERLLVNICNELVVFHNYEVAIFLLESENKYQNSLNKKVKVAYGNTSINLSIYKRSTINNQKYIDFINEFNPQIVHSHLFWADLLVHSYQFKPAKYVSHVHNSNIDELTNFNLNVFYKKRTWTNLYEKMWLIKRYKQFKTSFIACSNGALSFHNKNIKTGKVQLIQNAISLQNRVTLNEITKQKIKLLWVGTFSEVKNPFLAINIAKSLEISGVDFSLKMAGNGALFEQCEKMIKGLSLHDKVFLLGEQEFINKEYERANCLLHTSKYEGLPMVFIEAMSYGLPVITTNCLIDNEIVIDDVNGSVIKTDSAMSFVKVIERLINSPILYSSMTKGALRTSKEYDIKKYITKLKLFYNELN